MVKDKHFLANQILFLRMYSERHTKLTKKGLPPNTKAYPFWNWVSKLDDSQLAKLIEKCYDPRPSKILKHLEHLRRKAREKNKYIEVEPIDEIPPSHQLTLDCSDG